MESLSQVFLSTTGIGGRGPIRMSTANAAVITTIKPQSVGFRARIANPAQCKVAAAEAPANKALKYMTGIIAKDLNKFGTVHEDPAVREAGHSKYIDWSNKVGKSSLQGMFTPPPVIKLETMPQPPTITELKLAVRSNKAHPVNPGL